MAQVSRRVPIWFLAVAASIVLFLAAMQVALRGDTASLAIVGVVAVVALVLAWDIASSRQDALR